MKEGKKQNLRVSKTNTVQKKGTHKIDLMIIKTWHPVLKFTVWLIKINRLTDFAITSHSGVKGVQIGFIHRM